MNHHASWAITHIVYPYKHYIPGANGGWTDGRDYPLFATPERASVPLPFEGYWEQVQ